MTTSQTIADLPKFARTRARAQLRDVERFATTEPGRAPERLRLVPRAEWLTMTPEARLAALERAIVDQWSEWVSRPRPEPKQPAPSSVAARWSVECRSCSDVRPAPGPGTARGECVPCADRRERKRRERRAERATRRARHA